jgi:hypothetical protein
MSGTLTKTAFFVSEMVILREEIKSLQTVKACLQLRITELEEESKRAREELAQRSQKQDEEDVSSFFLYFWFDARIV